METTVIIDGKKLESLLYEKYWTMTKLAARSEVAYSNIRDLVKGKRSRIRRSTLCKIADALETSPDSLLPVGNEK